MRVVWLGGLGEGKGYGGIFMILWFLWFLNVEGILDICRFWEFVGVFMVGLVGIFVRVGGGY